MGSRFDTIPIPRWGRYDDEFATLLDSLEASLAARRKPPICRANPWRKIIHDLSEGLIGEVVEIVHPGPAVAAISRGEDRITGANPVGPRLCASLAAPAIPLCVTR